MCLLHSHLREPSSGRKQQNVWDTLSAGTEGLAPSSALPWLGPAQWLPSGAQGMDLHRSFSSRVPLEVTDSAWMNSENSIRPSWRERGAGGLGQSGHLVRPDLGQVVGSGSSPGERGRQTPHGEGGSEGMRDRTRKGEGRRGEGLRLEMGQAQRGRKGQEEGVRHREDHNTGTTSGQERPGGPLPRGLDTQAGAPEEDGL